MINWALVLTVPVAVAVGAEIGRRRLEAAGKIYSFIPRRWYRVLVLLMGAAVVLFFEAARVTLAEPSSANVWLLILSGTAAQIFLVAMHAEECRYAKKHSQYPPIVTSCGTVE